MDEQKNTDPDDGLVEEVESLKGRVDNIEDRVNNLADMFETYMDEDDE